MERVLILTALALSVGWGNPTHAADLEGGPRRENLNRVEYLIRKLASENPAPPVKGDASMGDDEVIRFPENYDKGLQVPVYLAAQQLLAEGEAALGPLLAHVGDERYSFSVNSGNRDYNVTVSRACEMIAERIILAFDPELHFITRSQDGVYPSEKSQLTLAKWWQANQRRGLCAIQIEAIDAMVAYMKSVEGKTASTTHPEALPLPAKEFNRLREDNLRILASIRRTLVERGEPYRAKRLDDEYRYIFGLPWTGRRHNK